MRKCLLVFFLLASFRLAAQPGYTVTALPDKEINAMFESQSLHFEINTTSDFLKLRNLSKVHSVYIIARLKTLPKEFYFLADSLREIHIDGADQLEDISVLATLKNLETIRILNYNGISLPNLSQLTRLKTLSIEDSPYKADKLTDINGIDNCKSLKDLTIAYSGIRRLDLDMSKMNIENLEIWNCRSLKNIDFVCESKSLKSLTLLFVPLERLPANMNRMDSLESIYLCTHELKDISNLNSMKRLRKVSISNASNLTEIPANFNTNVNLEDVGFKDFYWSDKFKSANGLRGLKKLKTLALESVPSNFILPDDFNTCENLESVEFVVGDSVYMKKNLSRIKDIPSLKKLYIVGSFSILPGILYTNKNLEDLSIIGNKYVKDLSGIANFKKLKKLELELNDNLIKIPDLKNELFFINQIILHNNKNLVIPGAYKNLNKNWKID